MASNNNLVTKNLRAFFRQLSRLFNYKTEYRKYVSNQILVAGGYGYGNTGDEAQCNETAKLLTREFPQYRIKLLSPNPDYTYKHHGYFSDYASRVLFYNHSRDFDCFNFDNSKTNKVIFLLDSIIIFINAFLVRANLPTLFINAQKAKLLYELKDSKLLYFCGGGFLTGKTQSRLWDGMVLCKLCNLFKTPVVMSGQTIGVWNTPFNKAMAKWALKEVKLITVRDNTFSLKDLKEIGLEGENIFYTHDDALFCEKTNETYFENNYIVLNFHYWGMKESEKTNYINKINKIIKHILETTSYNIVFIPMQETDKNSYDDYIQKYPNARICYFDYDFDFRKVRKVISDAYICITMKHHPIIFSMGENIPVISLDFSDYYVHKNVGALQQYNMEKFSINFEKPDYFDQFKELFDELLNNKEHIVSQIIESKQNLIERKNIFINKVRLLLSSSQ